MIRTCQNIPAGVVIFLCAVLLLSSRPPATASESPVAEIRAVLDAQMEAWNRGDIDGYMDGYAREEETQFVSGDTVTRGWQTVRDRYAKKYDTAEKMGKLSFTEVEITLLGEEAALVVGRWKLERAEDQPQGRFTLVFRRTRDGWRIVHDHTSSATS
jgi:beta-aspartyl-peptidase (threonine type)